MKRVRYLFCALCICAAGCSEAVESGFTDNSGGSEGGGESSGGGSEGSKPTFDDTDTSEINGSIGASCSMAGKPVCVNNIKRKYCENHKIAEEICPSGKCENGECAVIPCSDSTKDSCDSSGKRHFCSSANVMIFETCPSDSICSAGRCVSKADKCTSEDTASCSDSAVLKRCGSDGYFVKEVCQGKCENGACVAESCEPATSPTICADDTSLKTCSSSKNEYEVKKCTGSTNKCFEGRCVECLDTDDAVCLDGKTRKYCKNNAYKTEACEGSCSGLGVCSGTGGGTDPVTEPKNSCKVHPILSSGNVISGNTSQGDTYASVSCAGDMRAMAKKLYVFEMNIEKTGFYKLNIKPESTAAQWGFIDYSACSTTAPTNYCTKFESSESYSEQLNLSKGSRFVFVGPQDGGSDFSFTASLNEMSMCETYGEENRVDLSDGTLKTFSGNTSSGKSAYNWTDIGGCTIGGSNGRETGYFFPVTKPSVINATLTWTPPEDINIKFPRTIALYVYSCSFQSGQINQKYCANTTKDKARNETSIELHKSLEPGDYGIYVDYESPYDINKYPVDFDYTLTLQLETSP